ncbi:eukaryotic translation initiation factor 2 subunit beta-like [Olea europaea subsp. europaea]|uniref:Eukaryotic translation initiation factor 2 subunit beta n=1 Tax=Olea europaea subsp. europaea TaxID=158383 RepID=A0A8S0QF45_OLEEU|nr:eukaryotic translation initiation factor 2 subunit beta-like [Olea europaea subsp. europaea]
MAEKENQNEVEEAGDIAPFDPTKMKKKKKVVIQDPAEDETVDNLAEKTESLSVSDGLETSFAGMKKKKKKPVHTDLLDDDKENAGDDLDGKTLHRMKVAVLGTVQQLLGRVFNILRENNPELAGDLRRTVMRPPQVLREGTKMHRQPEHVMMFLLAEMGTSGSLDGQQRLVVKGRFAPRNFEGILRRYVSDYVICNGCRSLDTILSKETLLSQMREGNISSSEDFLVVRFWAICCSN